MNKSDHDLFCKLCAPTHALNHLLPPTRKRASLRTRGHSYQLPEYSTDFHKKSSLIHSLYSFVKWNSFFGFAALYCTSFWLRCLCLLFDVRLSHLINITYIHTRSDTQTTIALPLIKMLSDRSAGMISRSFQETLWPQFIRICTVFASVLMKKLILPDRVANPQYHTDPDLLQDVFYWQLEFSFMLSRRLSPYHMHGIAHTHTHTRLTALFPGLSGWASTRKAKPIWILLKQETVSGSGFSWAICNSAPCSRQITMPAPHHSGGIAFTEN